MCLYLSICFSEKSSFDSSDVASSYDVISESHLPGSFVSILKPRPRHSSPSLATSFVAECLHRAKPHQYLSFPLPFSPSAASSSSFLPVCSNFFTSAIIHSFYYSSLVFSFRPAGLKYSTTLSSGSGSLFISFGELSALRLYGARNTPQEKSKGGKRRKPRGKMKSSTLIAAALALCTSLASAGVVITPVEIDQTVPSTSGDCFFGVSTPFGCA